MKNSVLKIIALAFSLLVSLTANAATYTFTFAGYNSAGVKIDTGLLTFNTVTLGTERILSATGNINGATITGLSSYAAADNRFIVPTATRPYFATLGGISFATTDRTYNIARFTTNGLSMSIADSQTDPIGYGTFNRGLNFTLVSNNGLNFSTITYSDFNVASVPEPKTYALMLLGLGLVTFSAQRRKTAQI